MIKTFLQLKEIDQLVGQLYVKNPELKQGKFGYAYKRFVEKNYEPTYKEYINELSDVRIDHALTDPTTKALLTDPDRSSRGFKYDKQGLKEVMKAEDAITKKFDLKEIEIVPYFVKEENLPVLTDEEDELLTGTLIE